MLIDSDSGSKPAVTADSRMMLFDCAVPVATC